MLRWILFLSFVYAIVVLVVAARTDGEECQCGVYWAMPPRGFERAVAEMFRSLGHQVRFTSETRDGGVDLYLLPPGGGRPIAAVECKHWRRPVGAGVVRAFASVLLLQDLSEGFIVAHSFSRGAYQQAKRLSEMQGREICLVEVCELCQRATKKPLWERWGARRTALWAFLGWVVMVVSIVVLGAFRAL